MNIDPDAPTTTAVFRTDGGDFNVSLFSLEGKLKFKLAQKALREVGDLSDKVMILREAQYQCTKTVLLIVLVVVQ